MSDEVTVPRAFELPVQRVETLDGRDGWQLLRECWHHAWCLSNWAQDQLRRADYVRLPGTESPPPPPDVDLYALAFGRPKARARKRRRDSAGNLVASPLPPLPPVAAACAWGGPWWAHAKESAVAVFKRVRDKYVAERHDVLWRGARAFASYRYPQPWPVAGKMWKAAGFGPDGKPYVRCALPGGDVVLRLRGGPEFGRQLALFRRVVSGDLPRLQLVIRQQGASPGCHRPTVADRGRECRVLVKMVAHVPAKERPGDRCLVLLTDPQAFWVAELDGRRAWVLNADHVRRGLAAHAEHLRRLRRLGEDGKAERRLGGNRHAAVRERLERLCAKHAGRMASWTHEAAAHLAGFAARQKVGEVLYLDRDRGFVPRFAWARLHALLADKLKAAGIAFYSESGAAGEQTPADMGSDDGGVAPCPAPDLQPSKEDDKWARITRLRETAARKVLAARRRSASHRAVSGA